MIGFVGAYVNNAAGGVFELIMLTVMMRLVVAVAPMLSTIVRLTVKVPFSWNE